MGRRRCCCGGPPFGCPEVPMFRREPPGSLQYVLQDIDPEDLTPDPVFSTTQMLWTPNTFSVTGPILTTGTLYPDARLNPSIVVPNNCDIAGDSLEGLPSGGSFTCWVTYRYGCWATAPQPCATLAAGSCSWGTADCYSVPAEGDGDPTLIGEFTTYLGVATTIGRYSDGNIYSQTQVHLHACLTSSPLQSRGLILYGELQDHGAAGTTGITFPSSWSVRLGCAAKMIGYCGDQPFLRSIDPSNPSHVANLLVTAA